VTANDFEIAVFDLIETQFSLKGYTLETTVRYEDLAPQRGRDIVVETTAKIDTMDVVLPALAPQTQEHFLLL